MDNTYLAWFFLSLLWSVKTISTSSGNMKDMNVLRSEYFIFLNHVLLRLCSGLFVEPMHCYYTFGRDEYWLYYIRSLSSSKVLLLLIDGMMVKSMQDSGHSILSHKRSWMAFAASFGHTYTSTIRWSQFLSSCPYLSYLEIIAQVIFILAWGNLTGFENVVRPQFCRRGTKFASDGVLKNNKIRWK